MTVDLAAIAAQFGDDPGAAAEGATITHSGTLWRWQSKSGDAPAAWYFVTIDGDAAARIQSSVARRGGFGSIRTSVRIGATVFQISLFPSKDPPGYLLPVKAAVRKAERLDEGSIATLSLTLPVERLTIDPDLESFSLRLKHSLSF